MSINVRITLDEAAFRQMTTDHGSVGMAVRRAASKVRDDAKRIIQTEGRIDTGALWQSIRVDRVFSDATRGAWYTVGTSLSYARFQHDGVRGPIVPRRASVLRFTPKGSSVAIFRPQTAGFEGIHFLTRPLASLTVGDFIR